MKRRDASLRNEIIGIIVLKICILGVLWFAFVHGARVPVDADAMARHEMPVQGLAAKGEPNGH
jgi:hypothetical protein